MALDRARADLEVQRASARAAETVVPITLTTTASQLSRAEADVQAAGAALAAAQKEVEAARAQLRSTQARWREAEARSTLAQQDLARMKQLVARDEISRQQYDSAVAAADAARAAVDSAQARIHQAEASLAQAELNLQYTRITAPVSGVVSKKTVEVGQVIQPGQLLMAIVPLEHIRVTANFKETQLHHMRPGQPAIISVDAYGGSKFQGRVDSIAGGLSASVDEATWALTSYLAANAIILPMTGWLANYFGRKALLIGAVVGFTGASVLCGLAPSLPLLVLFRILQGLSGGTLQPLSQAVMLEAFPPRERGQAMAFWGLGIVVAPTLGPVLGGWLTDNLGWRWVFYINLPVGIVSVIMIMLFIFDPPYIRRRASRVDYRGIGMLTLGIGALQIALDQGQEEDWFASRWIKALAITAAVTLVPLVAHELRTRHPVVDLRVLKVWTYSAGTLLMTMLGFVLVGSMVLLPILVQTLLGYPALQAGIAMAPRGLGSFLAMPIIGMLMMRFDPRKLLVVGLLGTAFTMFQLSWLNLNTGYWDIFWPQFFQGLALGCLFVPLTTVTMDPIPKEEMGNATSIFNMTRNIGGSMGIAAVTTYLERRTQLHVNVLGANVSAYDPKTRLLFESIRKGLMGRGSDAATATQQAYRAMFGMVQRQAAMLSFLETFRVLGIVSLVLMPLLLLMRRPKHHRRAAVAE